MNLGEEHKLINLVISREDIEEFDFTNIYGALMEMHENPRKFYNKLCILIHGYDNDPRELHELPEIRDYLDFLDRSFPYWFYYLNHDFPKHYSPLALFVTCLCPIEDIQKSSGVSLIQFNIDELEKFIFTHFHFMNELMDQEGHSDKEVMELSVRILSLIYN
ncbi:chlororespiratory reduction 6 domain-containing protein [Fulvivirga ligni]|uniref:chlororespiratory reduction 6 domain-containing protein n=1 Tax=Fulvivirga ligni TaxID=2904246 RepID=UPI001F246518|nr:chlororespiratory reduction 6 domain-containing protein [Fulvivirga ligni]UII19616.1 chlororespiratory reduction 6 domain-containing protein [Fulvivirga ligni]